MKCAMCDNSKTLKAKRVNMLYKQSGLENIWLEGVIQYHCSKCGETYSSFGNLDQLHDLIANRLILKTSNLTGAEVRFLRTVLGYNSKTLCDLIKFNPQTLSRLENRKNAEVADKLDRLMRYFYASKSGKPDRDYDLHDQLLNKDRESPKEIRLQVRANNWRNSPMHASH